MSLFVCTHLSLSLFLCLCIYIYIYIYAHVQVAINTYTLSCMPNRVRIKKQRNKQTNKQESKKIIPYIALHNLTIQPLPLHFQPRESTPQSRQTSHGLVNVSLDRMNHTHTHTHTHRNRQRFLSPRNIAW